MSFFRPLIAFALLFVAGCSAQSPAPDAELHRKIELQLRAKFTSIPSYVEFKFGDRRPSEFTGYDLLPVTLEAGEHKSTLEFLISKDNKTLARLDKMDINALPAATIKTEGRPVRGNANAKVTIINFDDFQCPYCAQMHGQLFTEVFKIYGDRVKVIYKDFPLTNIHPWAVHAAVDANCLAEQSSNAYWAFADYVHENQQDITKNAKGEKRPLVEQQKKLDEAAMNAATKEKVDTARLTTCMKKQDETAVKASMKEGDALGIDATPTLFVNGERVAGAIPLDQLRLVLDRALRAEGVSVPEEPKSAPAAEKK